MPDAKTKAHEGVGFLTFVDRDVHSPFHHETRRSPAVTEAKEEENNEEG